MKKIIAIIVMIFMFNSISAVLISDQGTNVKEITTGNLLSYGNLTIEIYDDASSGNLIFNQEIENGVVNGSWNLIINPNLEYGKSYWKDYKINGEDVDFDGSERLEFQSPLGLINNVSFINFSMINSCPEGNAIRLIYANGSVECEEDNSGSGSSDLTDYALKNRSETFDGNITTSQIGFFGWLGSIVQRITGLFVQDIDASGNVDVTGNVTAAYFLGDGSLLTNLPAGSENDPIFISENSSLWNAINQKLNGDDSRYNESALIISINTTSNIMNLEFYNKSEVDDLISSVGGDSFNQSFTDTRYYSISNPSNFINETTGQKYNDTSLVLTINSSLWNYINTKERDYLSTYNSTYATWSYNQTAPAISYAETINSSLSSRINEISGGNESFNQTLSDDLYIANLNEGNLNVNSTSWWASLTGWVSGWFVQEGNNLQFNETKLNNAIDSRINGYNETGYIDSHLQNYYNKLESDNNLSLYLLVTDGRYNETAIIGLVNVSLSQRINNIPTANSSFNESLTDTRYYSISNPSNFIDITTGQIFNETNYINGLLQNYYDKSQTYTKSEVDNNLSYYLLITNQKYNETDLMNSINQTLNDRINIISTNSTFNQSLTDSLYYKITNPSSFVNLTSGQIFNETSFMNIINNSLWDYISNNENFYLSTYNSTYHQWAYNQTTSANDYTNLMNQTQTNWINSAFLKIVDFFTIGGDNKYLYNDSNTMHFNETKLNNSIDIRNSNFNDTLKIDSVNSSALSINTTKNIQNLIDNSSIARIGGCSVGQIVQNITTTGVQCIADAAGTASGGNPFNQVLNTTSDVTFNNLSSEDISANSIHFATFGEWIGNVVDGVINVFGNLRVEGTGNFSGGVVINNGTKINNINICSGTDKSKYNGTDFVCEADSTGGGGSSSISDSDFERESGTVFFEPFLINNAIETGEVGRMGWNYVAQGSGAGASGVVPTQGNHPGQLRLSTGTTTGGNATLDLGITMNFDTYSGNITYEWMFNLSDRSGGTNNYTLVMGFGDNLGTTVIPVDGIFFLHNATNSNWYAVTSSNSVRTINLTSVTVPNGAWTRMRIDLLNQSTNIVNFYINDALVASQGTNIPQGTARAMGPVFTLRKNQGTTARTLALDYVYYKQTFQMTR